MLFQAPSSMMGAEPFTSGRAIQAAKSASAGVPVDLTVFDGRIVYERNAKSV